MVVVVRFVCRTFCATFRPPYRRIQVLVLPTLSTAAKLISRSRWGRVFMACLALTTALAVGRHRKLTLATVSAAVQLHVHGTFSAALRILWSIHEMRILIARSASASWTSCAIRKRCRSWHEVVVLLALTGIISVLNKPIHTRTFISVQRCIVWVLKAFRARPYLCIVLWGCVTVVFWAYTLITNIAKFVICITFAPSSIGCSHSIEYTRVTRFSYTLSC